jgi:hypothetical protein
VFSGFLLVEMLHNGYVVATSWHSESLLRIRSRDGNIQVPDTDTEVPKQSDSGDSESSLGSSSSERLLDDSKPNQKPRSSFAKLAGELERQHDNKTNELIM